MPHRLPELYWGQLYRGSAQRSRAARRRSLRGDSPSLGAVARVFVGRAKWRCCCFACSRRHPASRRGARHAVERLFESLEPSSQFPRGYSEELGVSDKRVPPRRIRGTEGLASEHRGHPIRVAQPPGLQAKRVAARGAAYYQYHTYSTNTACRARRHRDEPSSGQPRHLPRLSRTSPARTEDHSRISGTPWAPAPRKPMHRRGPSGRRTTRAPSSSGWCRAGTSGGWRIC